MLSSGVTNPELLDFINWTLLPQLGPYPHGAITGGGETMVPPTEPGDKPTILRLDDRPKKQSTRPLKAECPECGLHDQAEQRRTAEGLSKREVIRCPKRFLVREVYQLLPSTAPAGKDVDGGWAEQRF